MNSLLAAVRKILGAFGYELVFFKGIHIMPAPPKAVDALLRFSFRSFMAAMRLAGYDVVIFNGLGLARRRRFAPVALADQDLSIVLPFYRKLAEFTAALAVNDPIFARNGTEVVIALDDAREEADLLSLLRSRPHIRWRVIVNDAAHEWRNPAPVINVGLRFARKSTVLVMSPECEFMGDVPGMLRAALGPRTFATGFVTFENYVDGRFPYGSLMARRDDLIRAGGYSEAFREWGGDDEEMRFRLRRLGLREVRVENAVLRHRERGARAVKRPSESSRAVARERPAQGEWGRAFDRVALDTAG